MNSTTNIEWTNHTINFWWGCTKVSPACTHCYAEEMGKRFGPRLFGQPVLWGAGKPRFERLEAARKDALKLNRLGGQCDGCGYIGPERTPCPKCGCKTWHKQRVLVNSMSDWLDEEVPLEWLAFLLETIHLCPNLDFQLLTKRPENWYSRLSLLNGKLPESWTSCMDMPSVARIPENIWIGCTAENQRYADERIPHLLKIPAKVRFLSMEPLSGPVDLARHFWCPTDNNHDGDCLRHPNGCPKPLHWIIAGGESGGKAEPSHPDWFRSLRDQCRAADVPFFFKQWGEWQPVDHLRDATHAAGGLQRSYKGRKLDDGTLMLRVGTKLAGHLLDGQEWRQFPR